MTGCPNVRWRTKDACEREEPARSLGCVDTYAKHMLDPAQASWCTPAVAWRKREWAHFIKPLAALDLEFPSYILHRAGAHSGDQKSSFCALTRDGLGASSRGDAQLCEPPFRGLESHLFHGHYIGLCHCVRHSTLGRQALQDTCPGLG